MPNPDRAALEAAELDELTNIVMNYPVFPGDTISHRTTERLRDLGLAKRDTGGEWIPTAKGIDTWNAAQRGGGVRDA